MDHKSAINKLLLNYDDETIILNQKIIREAQVRVAI